MLKSIKKKLGILSSKTAEEVEMTVNEGQTIVAAEDKTAELMATLSTATDALAKSQEQLAELSAKYEQAKAALAAVEEAKAALVAEAKEKQLAARKQRVEMAIGTDKAPALLAATENLDDVQFEAIVSAMAISFDAEASSQMFQEVGVSAEVDPTKVVAESAEMQALKQKYKAK